MIAMFLAIIFVVVMIRAVENEDSNDADIRLSIKDGEYRPSSKHTNKSERPFLILSLEIVIHTYFLG